MILYLLHPHLKSLLVAILQLHLPMSLTQEGFRKGQLVSDRLILTLLQRGLSIAARMFVIYMLLCVHKEMQGLLYLQKLKSAYAHNHVFLHLLQLKRTKCGHRFGATIALVRPSATPCDRSHLPRCSTGEREKERRDRKRNCHPCDPRLL